MQPVNFRPSPFVGEFFKQLQLDGRDRAIYINMAIQEFAFDHFVKTYTGRFATDIQLKANSVEQDELLNLRFFLPKLINLIDSETLMHAESPAETIDGKPWNGIRELTAKINLIFHNSVVTLNNGDSYKLQRCQIEDGMALQLIKM